MSFRRKQESITILPVIPAKAGIHHHPSCHSCESRNPSPPFLSFLRRQESITTLPVIPAKAGIHHHPSRHSCEGRNPCSITNRNMIFFAGSNNATCYRQDDQHICQSLALIFIIGIVFAFVVEIF
jgi:hypothetical protein